MLDLKTAITIAKAAGLIHDIGKASAFWQKNVLFRRGAYVPVVRHEFMSAVLFIEHCVKHGLDFDSAVAKGTQFRLMGEDGRAADTHIEGIGRKTLLQQKGKFRHVAQAIAYVVMTHHRLPMKDYATASKKTLDPVKFFNKALPRDILLNPLDEITLSCIDDVTLRANTKECYDFCPKTFPVYQKRFLDAWRALDLSRLPDEPLDPLTLYVARALMISADHFVSALDALDDDKAVKHTKATLYANTKQGGGGRQTLLNHLLSVSRAVDDVSRFFTDDQHRIAFRTITQPPLPRSQNDRFAWQDHAADMAASMDTATGAFCVCVASTGTGKTIGTFKVMQAMGGSEFRLTYAVGLRSLTRQTQKAYCAAIGIAEEDVALIIGKQDVEDEALTTKFDATRPRGSESRDPSYGVESALLCSPVVTCTIDQLMPTTESCRGGAHIEPFFRVATSDIILDEIDDYGLTDMPAICRLVFMMGRMKRRITVSSATLSPDIIRLLQDAYFSGQRASGCEQTPYLIYDEHGSVCGVETAAEPGAFHRAYAAFIDAKVATLHKRFTGEVVTLPEESVFDKDKNPATVFAQSIMQTCAEHHARHSHAYEGTRVSLGIVRITNVKALFSVITQMFSLSERYKANGRPITFHIRPYHAAMTVAQRDASERAIDEALNRKEGVLSPSIRALVSEDIASGSDAEHAFIVVASPVCETGRDIDADYAVTEPSSMKSLIQLAGRVRRHRYTGNPDDVCLSVLSYPFRFLSNQRNGAAGRAAYIYPGFERNGEGEEARLLLSRDAHDALRYTEYAGVTSAPRLKKAEQGFDAHRFLCDLEHEALEEVCQKGEGLPARVGMAALAARYPKFLLSGALSANQIFRFSAAQDVWLRYDEGACGDRFYQRTRQVDLWQAADTVLCVPVEEHEGCRFWPVTENASLPNGTVARLTEVSGKGHFNYRFNRNIGFALNSEY